MTKAFWTIRTAVQGELGSWKPNLPDLPSMRMVNPCDINRLLPNVGAGVNHTHLIVGGMAIGSDNDGVNGRHEHYVVRYNDAWFLNARAPATNHVHLGNAAPDFFMCFVACSDTTYTELLAAPHNVKPICHASIYIENGKERIGALEDVAWSPADLSYWQSASLSTVGITLPAQVERGKRLVMLLLGMLLARKVQDDIGYRLYDAPSSGFMVIAPDLEAHATTAEPVEVVVEAQPEPAVSTVKLLGKPVKLYDPQFPPTRWVLNTWRRMRG